MQHLVDIVNLEVVYGHDRDAYTGNQSSPAPARSLEDQYPAAATAAVALAQLHSHRPESEWESEAVSAIFGGRVVASSDLVVDILR